MTGLLLQFEWFTAEICSASTTSTPTILCNGVTASLFRRPHPANALAVLFSLEYPLWSWRWIHGNSASQTVFLGALLLQGTTHAGFLERKKFLLSWTQARKATFDCSSRESISYYVNNFHWKTSELLYPLFCLNLKNSYKSDQFLQFCPKRGKKFKAYFCFSETEIN